MPKEVRPREVRVVLVKRFHSLLNALAILAHAPYAIVIEHPDHESRLESCNSESARHRLHRCGFRRKNELDVCAPVAVCQCACQHLSDPPNVEAEFMHLVDMQAIIAQVEENRRSAAMASSLAGIYTNETVFVLEASSCDVTESVGAVSRYQELANFERYGGYALLHVALASCSASGKFWKVDVPPFVVCV